MNNMNQLICTFLVLFSLNFYSKGATDAPRPNVLIFFLDDMGWAQPGCAGGKLAPTPNMDSLAKNGVRFVNGYVSGCVCSPSRVGIMTGRYQQRSGHDNLTTRPGTELDLKETTMAQRMKAAGYITGIVGKWHLGITSKEYLPALRGFDYSFGTTSNLGEGSGKEFYRGTEIVEPPVGSPVTSPIYRDEVVKFLSTNQKKPWFLYFAFNAVHAPHVASDSWISKFTHISDLRTRKYAAMIAEADAAIGTVMAQLRELKLEENTLVFCISDNGGAAAQAEMGGLRGHKWLLWEGGIRVPWLVQWKGHIPAGQLITEPVIQLDVLPTALAASGTAVQPDWQLDGVNILPLLEGKISRLERNTLYWRYGPQFAVRQEDWKLVKAAVDMQPMLVNLAQDPGETNNLAVQNPAKATELQVLWDKWNASMKPARWDDPRSYGEEAKAALKSKKNDKKAKKKAKG
jgi:arylsulfatase A-like enzyme